MKIREVEEVGGFKEEVEGKNRVSPLFKCQRGTHDSVGKGDP